jgi:hypothetical protein
MLFCKADVSFSRKPFQMCEVCLSHISMLPQLLRVHFSLQGGT